jgi:NAD(P)-dependent dehydrogenase (short-subunit alcohol dehydrogenase family)
MNRNKRFEDQVVVVTGAARGIGLVTAEMLAREGAQVILCDLDQAALTAAAKRISDDGGRAFGLSCDVSNAPQVRECATEIVRKYGRIDVLVNNAAVTSYHPPEALPEEVWRREIDVCLGGTFFWSQSVAAVSMIAAKKGVIVNVGSGASLAGIPRCAGYISAKHGVVGLTKSLAVDWGQFGIRVNCVCPGLTYTELSKFVAEKNPEMMKQRELRIPLQRGAFPEDVANAILFLASHEADSISGVALSVDGGTLALSSGFSAPRDER